MCMYIIPSVCECCSCTPLYTGVGSMYILCLVSMCKLCWLVDSWYPSAELITARMPLSSHRVPHHRRRGEKSRKPWKESKKPTKLSPTPWKQQQLQQPLVCYTSFALGAAVYTNKVLFFLFSEKVLVFPEKPVIKTSEKKKRSRSPRSRSRSHSRSRYGFMKTLSYRW